MKSTELINTTHRSSSPDLERRSTSRDHLRLPSLSTPSLQPLQPVRVKPSARKRSMRALSEALDEMDDVLCLASHELRSPLMTILACLQLAGSRMERLASLLPDTPDVGKTLTKSQELLAMASRQVEVEDRIASDLVDASRIHAAQLTLMPQFCELGKVVEKAVAGLRVVFPRRIIRLVSPDQEVLVSADSTRIEQVVANLLTNALKYSPADQPITVRVAIHGASAGVSVRDYGPGLEKADLKRVWERFYRVHSSAAHSEIGSGLGLGLYIVREIVQGHGGRVGVTSKPAQGATFWFTLPLVHAA
jgi:signal transduction histidine kinase